MVDGQEFDNKQFVTFFRSPDTIYFILAADMIFKCY